MDAYETSMGCSPASSAAEWELLMEGEIHAIAFSSTAEVRRGFIILVMGGGKGGKVCEVHATAFSQQR